jgi:hypothetical protein
MARVAIVRPGAAWRVGRRENGRGRELQRPMLGAQRRIEARIGQLLGEPAMGGRGKLSSMPEGFDRRHLGADFRLLARALDGECVLTEEEWQKSRRALVSIENSNRVRARSFVHPRRGRRRLQQKNRSTSWRQRPLDRARAASSSGGLRKNPPDEAAAPDRSFARCFLYEKKS